MAVLLGPDAHVMLTAAVSTKNVVLITDTIMCITELVEEIQTRFQVSLRPGVGKAMTFSNSKSHGSLCSSGFGSEILSDSLESFQPSKPSPLVSDDQHRQVRPNSSSGSTTSSTQHGIQCPLCEETVPDRSSFTKHLKDHSFSRKSAQNIPSTPTHLGIGTAAGFHTNNPHDPPGHVISGISDAVNHVSLQKTNSVEKMQLSQNLPEGPSRCDPRAFKSDSFPAIINPPVLACPVCKKQFSRSYQLSLHLKRHPDHCGIGSRRIGSKKFNFSSNRARHDAISKKATMTCSSVMPIVLPTSSPSVYPLQISPGIKGLGGSPNDKLKQDSNPDASQTSLPASSNTKQQASKTNSIELPISVNNFKKVVATAAATSVVDDNGRIQSMYQCIICAKLVQTRHSLESHYMSHLGIKPYACAWCSKRFTDASNWRKHQKNCAEQKAAELSSDLPTMVPPNYGSYLSLNPLNSGNADAERSHDGQKRPSSSSSALSNTSIRATTFKHEPVDISSDSETATPSIRAIEASKNQGMAFSGLNGTEESLQSVVVVDNSWFDQS